MRLEWELSRRVLRVSERTAVLVFVGTFFFAGETASQPKSISDGAHPARSSASLDGRRYKAGIVRTGSGANPNRPLRDRLIFKNGKFMSEICQRYNFKEAPYSIRSEGNQIYFSVELRSPTDGVMMWKGTIRGRTLEGTMRWIRKRWYRTIDVTHTITGVLEGAPPVGQPGSQ